MLQRGFAVPAALVVLTGCQTNYSYERIAPGPELVQAQAYCEIMSSGTQRGVVAWGSPSYVAGAQIGNAIDNAIRADQFMKNCMILAGWQRVSSPVSAQASAAVQRQNAATAKAKSAGQYFPPPPR